MYPFKAGDVAYAIGDWSAGIDESDTLEEIRKELGELVIETNAGLRLIGQPADLVEGKSYSVFVHGITDHHYPLLSEALTAAAKQEEEYGKKCLRAAARLRELAQEAHHQER